MSNNYFYKTSESVSTGHPDKVCDQIADAIFDYLRTFKKDAQSAIEVAAAAQTLMIFGEIDKDIVQSPNGETLVRKANPQLAENIENIAKKTLTKIGYTEEDYNPTILIELVTQSAEINNAVEANENTESGAGDQGIVTGYAHNETSAYHELHYWLANRLIVQLQELQKEDQEYSKILLPDAKSQVTVKYDNNYTPVAIDNILLSQSHTNNISFEELTTLLTNKVTNIIRNIIEKEYTGDNKDNLIDSLYEATIRINPAGAWTNSYGPAADSGLTSRKLVVDNYGSAAPIGGGGQAGKNANKVDRSGACYARWIAKNIVAEGLAQRALVEIGFAIGVSEAVSFNIETFNTNTVEQEQILDYVNTTFGTRHTVNNMITLCDQINSYEKSAENGFYTNQEFPWEKLV